MIVQGRCTDGQHVALEPHVDGLARLLVIHIMVEHGVSFAPGFDLQEAIALTGSLTSHVQELRRWTESPTSHQDARAKTHLQLRRSWGAGGDPPPGRRRIHVDVTGRQAAPERSHEAGGGGGGEGTPSNPPAPDTAGELPEGLTLLEALLTMAYNVGCAHGPNPPPSLGSAAGRRRLVRAQLLRLVEDLDLGELAEPFRDHLK